MSAYAENTEDVGAIPNGPRVEDWYSVPNTAEIRRRDDSPASAKNKIHPVPEFTGSAMGIDRGDNPLYHVPIDSSGAVSFGNWPYPGKGLYGLGYNFKPMASVVMPMLLIAGLAMLYPGLVNVARFGRKKRSLSSSFPDEAEERINQIHRDAVTAREVCWKKFVCESQKVAMENQIFKTLVQTFRNVSGDEAEEEARRLDDEGMCDQYECDFLSSIFEA